MIIGTWHPGSGVGDQIFCYLAARVIAERLGVDLGMVGEFKGESFIKLDRGKKVSISYIVEQPAQKIVIQNDWPVFESKTNYYNPEFNFIEDDTIVDGCTLQDERYWDLPLVKEWLNSDILKMKEDVCVINLRGGEYRVFSELLLPVSYWNKAIEEMKKINPNMKFEVHTDDLELAKIFFPEYKAIHDVGLNWRSVRDAHYSILSNSAFGIIPALLSPAKKIIAPRWWARHNIKEWSMPSNYYSRFQYI